MPYIYTEVNRLDSPHKYMYTKFEGYQLIKSYFKDRMDTLNKLAMSNGTEEASCDIFDTFIDDYFLKTLDKQSSSAGIRFHELMTNQNQLNVIVGVNTDNSKMIDLANVLPTYTVDNSIETFGLLQSTIASQLMNLHDVKVKEWLDIVLQRFEVTKKLYEVYGKGYRKGEGSNSSVLLYWLLALSLSLYYAKTQSIKYLSTLLKVCDLLCSLPDSVMFGHLSRKIMATIISTEIISVETLVQDKVKKNAI